MRYLSVCSGIEAATVAWHGLGWQAAGFAEIDPSARAVLQHHYPDVPLHGDFTALKEKDYEAIDLLVGGTPCQSFSIAGLRKGLDDDRGNLSLEFIRLAQKSRARWLVWENVPGILSVDKGRAFGTFLGGLAECGYGFAYRVLDAQYFGVPQRRRRVFVIGYLGDWRRAAAVLFEPESLRGDITPIRKTEQEVAGTLGARTCRSVGAQDADCGHLMALRGDGVRRLTPRECERLQGFPEIKNNVTIRVWSTESQKNFAIVETSNHKLQEHALNAEESTSQPRANHVGALSNASRPECGKPVAMNVRLDLERMAVEISNAGKLLWRANAAGKAEKSPLSMPGEDFAHLLALMPRTLAPLTRGGRAELPQSISLSMRGLNGSVLVNLSGQEIKENAADVGRFIKDLTKYTKSTTSDPGQNSLNCASAWITWCCSVVNAISGFIPETIWQSNPYAVIVETITPYTLVSVKGKAAVDGPRYKALGNSMHTGTMRWIGERINMVELQSADDPRKWEW